MHTSWIIKDKKLSQTYTFNTFNEALVFANKVGEIAEAINHHPDILLHDYNSVTITTYTHDTGAVTEKDHELAEKIDRLL